jgi:hypothetical protein
MKIGDKITVSGIVTNIIPGYESDKVEIDHSYTTEISHVVPVHDLVQTLSLENNNVQTPDSNETSTTENNFEQPSD